MPLGAWSFRAVGTVWELVGWGLLIVVKDWVWHGVARGFGGAAFLWAWDGGLSVGVHIRYLRHGDLGFRPYGGSLWKSPKVSKGLLPQHSAPRLGSVCP